MVILRRSGRWGHRAWPAGERKHDGAGLAWLHRIVARKAGPMKLTMASEHAAETSAAAPAARIVSGVKDYGTGPTAVRALDPLSAGFGARPVTAGMGALRPGEATPP